MSTQQQKTNKSLLTLEADNINLEQPKQNIIQRLLNQPKKPQFTNTNIDIL